MRESLGSLKRGSSLAIGILQIKLREIAFISKLLSIRNGLRVKSSDATECTEVDAKPCWASHLSFWPRQRENKMVMWTVQSSIFFNYLLGMKRQLIWFDVYDFVSKTSKRVLHQICATRKICHIWRVFWKRRSKCALLIIRQLWIDDNVSKRLSLYSGYTFHVKSIGVRSLTVAHDITNRSYCKDRQSNISILKTRVRLD